MKVWIGLHTHRHGVSVYPFNSNIPMEKFIEFLGDDYEEARDDEYLEIIETELLTPPH